MVKEINAAVQFIIKACEATDQSPIEVIFHLLHDKNFILVKYEHGYGVFQKTRESIHAVSLCGKFVTKDYENITYFMEDLAKRSNLNKLSLEGRKGWERRLKQFGWIKEDNILVRYIK